MKLSVIIPTFNEEKYIDQCLQSLKLQTYKDFEIIVVDDGSTDNTLGKLSGYQVLQQKHQGPAIARNLGAKHSQGEILVFVDADMTFDKKFLEKLTAPIRNKKTIGTWSKDEYVQNWDNLLARSWNINQNLPGKRRLSKNMPDRHKVFRAILKKEFVRAGGFSKGGYTDDWSLSEKLNTLAEMAPKAVYYHNNPDTLGEVFHQAKWVAKRNYKLGAIGVVITLVKSLFPISIIIGLYKATRYHEPSFIIFKVIYDLATIVGLLEMSFGKSLAK